MAATFLELATAKSLNVARPGIPTAGGHHGRGREQRPGRQLSQGTSRKFSLGFSFLGFFSYFASVIGSVADPNPDPDPRVFGPPGSGSTSQRYGSGSGSCSGSGSGSFYHHAKIVRKTLIPPIL